MANIKRVTINRTAFAQHESDLEPTYELKLDEYEITMLRAALRVYRLELLCEMMELEEEHGALLGNPELHDAREWVDRVTKFRKDVA